MNACLYMVRVPMYGPCMVQNLFKQRYSMWLMASWEPPTSRIAPASTSLPCSAVLDVAAELLGVSCGPLGPPSRAAGVNKLPSRAAGLNKLQPILRTSAAKSTLANGRSVARRTVQLGRGGSCGGLGDAPGADETRPSLMAADSGARDEGSGATVRLHRATIASRA